MLSCELNTEEERREAFVARYYPGQVLIEECAICGFLVWVSTYRPEANGYSVRPLGSSCPCCYQIRQRAPEIYEWVINVVAHTIKNLE